MEVGAHTRHHVDLSALPDDEARQRSSKAAAKQTPSHAPVRHFCYPYRAFSAPARGHGPRGGLCHGRDRKAWAGRRCRTTSSGSPCAGGSGHPPCAIRPQAMDGLRGSAGATVKPPCASRSSPAASTPWAGARSVMPWRWPNGTSTSAPGSTAVAGAAPRGRREEVAAAVEPSQVTATQSLRSGALQEARPGHCGRDLDDTVRDLTR